MENNNSVCYINRITEIHSIENADKIELAFVDGWCSVIQKNTFKVGDSVLCITTDAIIPEKLAETFGVAQYLRKGNRVRTVKLKGTYSDCILIPCNDNTTPFTYYEGMDCMNKFNIYKYEEPEKIIQLASGRKIKQKDNPNFNKYHKFPNIKNTPHLFQEGDDCVITRKIHGTNARYGIVKKSKLSLLDRIKILFGNKWATYEYVYGSHNVIKGNTEGGFYAYDVWQEIGEKFNIENKLWKFVKTFGTEKIGTGIIFYGEIYGEGIQGKQYNYGLTNHRVAFFDIEKNKQYLPIIRSQVYCDYIDLPFIEILYTGRYSKEIVNSYVLNQYINNTKTPHEGVVVSCITGNRGKIAKVINPDYTLYAEKHLVPEGH